MNRGLPLLCLALVACGHRSTPASSSSGAVSVTALPSASVETSAETTFAELDGDDENIEGIGGLKFERVDTSKAPSLGGDTSKPPVYGPADWLSLPGDALEIANPKAWEKAKPDAEIGTMISPDKTAFVLFTTYDDPSELRQRTDMAFRVVKVGKVAWRKPKQVRLGSDRLPAHAMSGNTTVPSGKARVVLVTIDSGEKKKVVAMGIKEFGAPAATSAQLEAILVSVRKKRR